LLIDWIKSIYIVCGFSNPEYQENEYEFNQFNYKNDSKIKHIKKLELMWLINRKKASSIKSI